MARARLINRPPLTTPTARGSNGDSRRDIPDDLLREAAHRLGIAAMLGVVLWFVGAALDHWAMKVLNPGDPRWKQLHSADAIVGLGILTSAALFAYSRVSRRSPRFMLDLGLGYLIVTALDIALIWHSNTGSHSLTPEPMFSWAACLVLIFAAIIPNPPGKTFLAGLIAASMNPLAMVVAKARGVWDFGPWSNALVMHYPDYIMVGVSVVISQVITRLGHHVTRAREMGSYRLGELLGRGGMGEVYRATHRMLARPAAIKLIRPEAIGDGAAGEIALRRFRREAEVAASLRSPHTVELYDFGVTENQTFFFVMELLDGLDLETLVRRHGPQPPNRVIHILRQVCDSLEEAHLRGLVHRDIKPANIHLGRLGLRHDFVKVLDFGLVKAVDGGGAASTLETGPNVTPGTPSYMAPEAALGEKIDGRTDLYSLGCVGYWLLTGKVVFEATSVLQAVARQINDSPISPSERSGLPVPPRLEQLILAMLGKRPDDRPATAGEVG
ncbi:MAG TPA: protein kinase, partial [Gemmatimonadales bacterium]|nr:protein kinase [Gemmatimonadales bacterium]